MIQFKILILGVNKTNFYHTDVLQVELHTRCCRNILKLFFMNNEKQNIVNFQALQGLCLKNTF